MKTYLVILIISALGLMSANAFGQLQRLCDPEKPISDLFSSKLLNALPEAALKSLLTKFGQEHGKCLKVQDTAGQYALIFEKATIPMTLHFDNEQLIDGIWFDNPLMVDDSLEKLKQDLLKLDGKVSILIVKENKEIINDLNQDQPLSVGSSFKLIVLKLLLEKIKGKKLRWEHVLKLNPKFKTLPSGIIQDWPDNHPITLATLADLMISKSDNTATDILINFLGRQNLERLSSRNVPFLTTNEMFKLHYLVGEQDLKKYLTSNIKEKRRFLTEIGNKNVTLENVQEHFRATETVGWFMTTNDLCAIIYSMKGEPIIGISSGLAKKAEWKYVGFKGGSSDGVLQMTHLLQNPHNSAFYCISTTINDRKRIDEDAFDKLVTRAIRLVRDLK